MTEVLPPFSLLSFLLVAVSTCWATLWGLAVGSALQGGQWRNSSILPMEPATPQPTERTDHIHAVPTTVIERILSFLPGVDIYRFLYVTVYDYWTWEEVKIDSLDFSRTRITDRALSYLTRSHIPIVFNHINLSYCPSLSGRSFKYLPKGLVTLNLASSSGISDKYLKSIGGCTSLNRLNLAGCSKLSSDATLQALLTKLRHLSQLNVYGCPLLTPRMHSSLARTPTHLQVDVFNLNVLPIAPSIRGT